MSRKMQHLYVIALFIAFASAGAAALHASDSRELAPAPSRPALTVSTEAPLRADLLLGFAAHGTVAPWQESSIGAEVSGLRLAAVHAGVGDVVRRGQVLATFASETTQAELAQLLAGVAEAEASATEATANADRARILAQSGALSEQQIAQFITAEQTARARLQAQHAAAEAQRWRLTRTAVLAPDDGIISSRTATVGAVMSAGQELFRLIRGGRLEWRAEVTAAELVRLQPGASARITTADGTTVDGTVRALAPTVDEHKRTGLVYVDVPATASLKAGMFARGQFELGRSSALTLPQQAIIIRDGFSTVFRVGADAQVNEIRVRTGRRDGERVEVLEGINADSQIVTRGAGFLSDGDLVSVAASSPVPPLAEAR